MESMINLIGEKLEGLSKEEINRYATEIENWEVPTTKQIENIISTAIDSVDKEHIGECLDIIEKDMIDNQSILNRLFVGSPAARKKISQYIENIKAVILDYSLIYKDIVQVAFLKVSANNANYHLENLYERRDRISSRISSATVSELDTYMKEYQTICDIIEKICRFRSHHDCLLKGDPGYGTL